MQADGPVCCSNNNEKYVVKEIPQDFAVREDIYQRIGNSPHVRTPSDSLTSRRMFIFPYLDENLLRLVQKNLPLTALKSILERALRGLAMLHERDIVHNGKMLRFVSHVEIANLASDIKPDNILIQMEQNAPGAEIREVRLADLEDSAYVPPSRVLRDAQLGNWMWRSPESHAMGPIEKPSDMFSLGTVVSSFSAGLSARNYSISAKCIYVMIQGVIFPVNEVELPEEVDKLAVVLEHQISYFADEDGFNGFLSYIGAENDWYEIFVVIKRGFGEEQPRRPFELWQGRGVDDCDFKDLIRGLTDFDPKKRFTAQQALSHRWFRSL